MPRSSARLLFALLGLVLPPHASATTVVVPDTHPTIQGAIDSGADTVLVKDGFFQEHVMVNRGFALLSYPSLDRYSRLGSGAR